MTASLHIQFYLNKLLNIYKLFQGTAANYISYNQWINKKRLKMILLIQKIKSINYYISKDPQFNKKPNMQMFKEIYQNNIESLLDKLNESLSKQYKDKKKYSEKTIRTNKTNYFNYIYQVYDLQQQLNLNAIIYQQQQTNNSLGQMRTLKNNLMDQDDRKLPSLLYMTQNQKDVIQRWEENNKEIDQQLDIIIDGTKQLKDNSKQIGQKIDNTTYQIDNIINEVDETNQDLNKQQNQLQRIVQKHRQPNQFFLIFILIGLCRVIYLNLN